VTLELTVANDLRQVNLAGVNFRNADLATSVFAESLSGILSVSFNPDGSLLATSDVDGKICLASGRWSTGFDIEGHAGWIWAVTFSPDGNTLASCSHDSLIRLWDVQTIDLEQSILQMAEAVISNHPQSPVSTLGHSSRSLPARDSADHGVTEWSNAGECDDKRFDSGMHDGTCLTVLQGHTGGVMSVSFSPNGQILAIASQDSSIRLWSVDQAPPSKPCRT